MSVVLRLGSTGEDVLRIKDLLRANGYTPSPGNAFDSVSVSQLEVFQLQHLGKDGKPLVSDGEVLVGGNATWWALHNASGEPQRSHLPALPATSGLTAQRSQLLQVLSNEYAKDVKEIPDGSNRSPDIDRYFGATGLKGLAWCCAFVSWCSAQVTGKNPLGKYHLGVQVMWNSAKAAGITTTFPKPGDVFVQIKSQGQGHTGFVRGVSIDGLTIATYEGNCGNRLKRGKRQASTIDGYCDMLQDGQPLNFERHQDDAADLGKQADR